MAEDWAIDVRKYVPDADEAAIAGIVRHCGIALRSRDASLVSFTDSAETDLVRESFCRKKLGLTQSDAELDAAIASVGERMKEDRTKNRVTVYYLLADMFGKLGLFGAAATATAATASPAAPEPVMTPAAAEPVLTPAAAVAAPLAAVAAAPAAARAAAPSAAKPARTRERSRDDGGIGGTALGVLGLMGLIVIGTATFGTIIGNQRGPLPMAPNPAPIAAPAAVATVPVATAIPDGAGVVAQDVEGVPRLSVYFDTASSDVSPDFAGAAAAIKAWIDSHPGDRLAVSGYNDPRGDAAFNAELSKNRAQRVAAALAALGVPEAAVDLEKPPETTDASTSLENARRVDIIVIRGG